MNGFHPLPFWRMYELISAVLKVLSLRTSALVLLSRYSPSASTLVVLQETAAAITVDKSRIWTRRHFIIYAKIRYFLVFFSNNWLQNATFCYICKINKRTAVAGKDFYVLILFVLK